MRPVKGRLDAGESVKALSEYLGHAEPGFTLRTHTHLVPTSEDRTRRAVDKVLGSPSDGLAAITAVYWLLTGRVSPVHQLPVGSSRAPQFPVRVTLRHLHACRRLHLDGAEQIEIIARDLTVRESSCCSFFTFDIARPGPDS
ncbi:hypothetical protein E1258_20025 [Micromonospora sp. KC207]|uniref:hypothetical protein n=1 Tax=Micromonospora sp. KC207 TaxID=2530377 RepID=UPI00104E8583|nr:hypothetical protein [Micromonospora sp. KC207]TDC58871.1 hypothetical protein E1258_20025 [Micromonospora sp. KC207]